MLFPRCYVTSLVALLTEISSTTTSQKNGWLAIVLTILNFSLFFGFTVSNFILLDFQFELWSKNLVILVLIVDTCT